MADRKRKKSSSPDSKPLFLQGTKVEVKSIEDGFQGSWHVAKIIKSRGQERIVKYCDLLDDDSPSPSPLIEQIDVSRILDGNFSRSDTLKTNRGRLRPAPQIRELSRESISYGLCVDAFHKDAWWEGVVIDKKEGNSDIRQVFFPDLGDELMSDIKSLRITYDWNEVTDEWKPRGNWVFLDIINSLECEYPIPVSIKQLWYDVRQRKEFTKTGEWACQDKLLWEKSLIDVISDYMDLVVDEALSSCDVPDALLENVESACVIPNSVLTHEPSTSYCQAIVASSIQDGGLMREKEDSITAMDKWDSNSELNTDTDSLDATPGPMVAASSSDQVAHVQPRPLSVIPSEMNNFVESGNNEGSSTKIRRVGKLKFKIKSGSGNYCLSSEHQTPAAPKSEVEPRFCPQSVTEYLASGDRPPNHLTNNVRNHLLSMGWKIKYRSPPKQNDHSRVFYTSPDGKKFYSLRQLLEKCRESLMENSPPIIIDGQERMPLSPDGNTVQLDSEPHCLQTDRTKSTGAIVVSKSEDFPVVPEYCPEAVSEYLTHPKNDGWLKKARKHLLSIGWKCWFQRKKRRHQEEWRYDSPTSGKTYSSLMSACRAIQQGNEENPGYSCSPCPMKDVMCIEGPKPQSGCELSLIDAEAQDLSQTRSADGITLGNSWSVRNRRLSKRKKTVSSLLENSGSTSWVKNAKPCGTRRLTSSISSKKQKVGKGRSISNGNSKMTRVLRSSKRVKVGPNSQIARTLLSWLIDNKVIMARNKVFYRKKRDSSVLLEGRIARDGIKCTCCHKLLSLSGFAAHARSTCQNPAANIFTEDGKSLVECQLLVLQSKLGSSSGKQLQSTRKNPHKTWNDHICSICHYGGDLILCDQCPSAFHAECLNLQDIPEGDWFCPACCCGICGFCQFDADIKQFTDMSTLCCYQCERKYHAHCIRKRDMVKLSVHPKENWFCCRTCEKVHWGLQQLLGKRILVGHDGLTWTLVKPILPDDGDCDDCDFVTMAEHYGKLSLALEVMHECFEPVIDPTTKQDVVENLIFSRGSDLNRLNFRGFYTVLLERDDALISVALLRVYGNKVAEIPFVATRFKHRRHGMCRILMNEIEKNLLNLEVERLVLPAAGSVLNTWTTSFGFSPVTQTDRSDILGYTLMDFQDSVMCQKLLTKHSSALSLLLRDVPGAHCEPCQDGNCNGLLDFEGNSGISNVFQQERCRGSEIVDQGEQLDCAEDKSYSGSVATDCSPPIVLCLMVGGATDLESEQCDTLKQKKVEGENKSYETQKYHPIVTDCPTPMDTEPTNVEIEQCGTFNQNKLEGHNKSDATLKDYQRKKPIEPLTISQVHPPKVEVSCR